jgi:hypothetical protein
MVYKADRELYLNEAGEIVERRDPSQFKLLIHQGGQIDTNWLERNGCAWDDEAERIKTPAELSVVPVVEETVEEPEVKKGAKK